MWRTVMSGMVATVLLAGCGGPVLPTTPAVMPGTAVTDDGLTVTVTDTSRINDLQRMGGIGGIYPGAIWVVVNLHVSSGGSRPALFDPVFQHLFVGGREYGPDPFVAELFGAEVFHDKPGSSASLSAGSEADVLLAFDVSDAPSFGTFPVRLVVHGDLDSPGAVVNLASSLKLLPPAPT